MLEGGADWQIVTGDGIIFLDTRYTLRTSDGALIYVQNKGVRHVSPEVLTRVMRSEVVDPSEYYFRATPILETGSPNDNLERAIIAPLFVMPVHRGIRWQIPW